MFQKQIKEYKLEQIIQIKLNQTLDESSYDLTISIESQRKKEKKIEKRRIIDKRDNKNR